MKKVLVGSILCLLLWFGCGSEDTTPPDVMIANPNDGSVVHGTVSISVSANDNTSVERVDLYINDTLVTTFNYQPYSLDWVTDSLPDSSSYSIYARAYDAAENEGVSSTITVMVDNTSPPVATVFIWDYDPIDLFYDAVVGDSVDCAYWIEQTLTNNSYTYNKSSALPATLNAYEAVFVLLGWYRC